jgi:hypothetical protein
VFLTATETRAAELLSDPVAAGIEIRRRQLEARRDGQVEAQIEADEIGYWFHMSSPLDNASVCAVLLDGLAEVRSAYREARAAHGHDRAEHLLDEFIDLTALCAAARTALDCQRNCWIADEPKYGPPRPWPLGSRAW